MPHALLTSRGILALTGGDVVSFLQGLLTNDLTRLTPRAPLFAALLTPQGKMLFDLILARQGDAVLLECERARLPQLMQRLTMYKLRTDVAIRDASQEMAVQAFWGEGAPPDDALPDPRFAALGWRVYGKAGDVMPEVCVPRSGDKVPENAYHARRLSLGVPEGSADLAPEQSLALENRLDELHGVDFAKGCYVGQEVTARSKHRGSVRKKLFILRGEGLPAPGAPLLADGKEAGVMRSSAGDAGLAMLKLESYLQVGDESGHRFMVVTPPYV